MRRARTPLVLSLLSLLLALAALASFLWAIQPPYQYGEAILPGAVALALLGAATALLAVSKHRRAVAHHSWFVTSVAVVCCLTAVLTPLAVRLVHGMRSYLCDKFLQHKVVALLAYEQEHGAFPQADTWCDALSGAPGHWFFVCPERPDLACGYALNAALSDRSLEDIADPWRTVLLFESDRGWNAAGDASLLPAEPRHAGQDHYGMVESFSPSRRIDRAALMDGSAGIVWDPMAATEAGSPLPANE